MLVMLAVNTFTYNVTPLWINQMKHFCLETSFDRSIPFVPVFAVIYILAYVQWFVGYYAVTKTNNLYCKYILWSEIISKIIVCFIFMALPTTMERATICNYDIFSRMVEFIYQIDRPINLFPSIHCLESWICYRSSRDKRYFGNKYRSIMGVITVLVFLSTVLIKQHLLIDMVGALIVAEIGLVISKFCVAKVYKNEMTDKL